jgi:hypothetical protein
VKLLKLVWNPDDIDVELNVVKPTAFRREDLTGQNGSHVSVDRSDMAERACMEKLASKQAEKANGNDIIRELAKIGYLSCGAVRASEDQGQKLFSVSSFPRDYNRAHCGIHSNSVVPKKGSAMDQLRNELVKLTSPPVGFDEAYGRENEADDP